MAQNERELYKKLGWTSFVDEIDIIEGINGILKKHKSLLKITHQDITITEKTVSDLFKKRAKLSEEIIRKTFPSIKNKLLSHFTGFDKFLSIVSSQNLRLTSILKRYDDGEIEDFCEAHQLKGYLEKDTSNAPVYKELIMKDLFYVSFTEENPKNELEMWRKFASTSNGLEIDGVKMIFSVTSKTEDFRAIYYPKNKNSPEIKLLSEISQEVKKYNRQFILKGISRICAFYLPSSLASEKEYRILHKKFSEDDGTNVIGNGASSYVELPFKDDKNNRFIVELKKVIVALPDQIEIAKNALAKVGLSDVVVELKS